MQSEIVAVINHKLEGQDRPIAYASRSFTFSQSYYSQLNREPLEIIFGASLQLPILDRTPSVSN